ncbi:MAG TPA: phosphotransferase [Candidatus Hydrogenedentes bacterium]|nr:phosphotransferase [Candidatus Hydrogenedentota bacterium]
MPFSKETLQELVCAYCGVAASAISLTPIPTGKFNTSYFVRADGDELVMRIAPPRDAVFVFYERDMMRQEPGLHALLLEKTSVPVAPIIAYDDSHTLLDRDFLLMKRLPGRPLTDAPYVDEAKVLRRVGRCLAEVHALAAEGRYGYLGEHAPMAPQPTWVDAFQMMWRKLVEDVAAVGYYDETESTALLGLLERHIDLFDRPVPSSLLHMDVWAQNILVDDASNLTGLVDWDRALWGDPEIEFAVLDYCGISKPAFWEGYGERRDTSPKARIRNVFYLLYEIQKYIVIRHGRNNDPAAAQQYKRQVMQIVAQLMHRT